MSRAAAFALALPVAFLPQLSGASVVINELMYDAQGTDTDQEYVEIYNNGSSAVDLTKWKVNDGSNHSLNVPPKNGGTGSITLPAGGYALLVDNATNFLTAHPGVSGTVIDTVLSLSNVGATISLVDESGATADAVSYSKDQGANGDGNSLQRSNGSWIVAAPTPLAQNSSTPVSPTNDSTTTSQQATQSSTTTRTNQSSLSTVPSYVAPPAPTVYADAGSDRTVTVGADATFSGRAYDKNQDLVDNVRFNWNFGDGTTAEGQSVMHHFSYPGKYVVVLSVAQQISAASDHVVVTAEPANLSFTVHDDGSVAIKNNSGRDIDISRWIVRSFARSFIFPDDTVILAGQILRISNATFAFPIGPQTELQYPNGTLAYRPGEQAAPVSVPVSVTATTSVAKDASTKAERKKEPATDTTAATEVVNADMITATSSAAAVASSDNGSALWWLSACGLALLASGAAYAVKKKKIGEWNIIEETGD